jgi:hypothetical protein
MNDGTHIVGGFDMARAANTLRTIPHNSKPHAMPVYLGLETLPVILHG